MPAMEAVMERGESLFTVDIEGKGIDREQIGVRITETARWDYSCAVTSMMTAGHEDGGSSLYW